MLDATSASSSPTGRCARWPRSARTRWAARSSSRSATRGSRRRSQLAGERDEPVDVEVELGRPLPRQLLVRVSRRRARRAPARRLDARAEHGGASAEPGSSRCSTTSPISAGWRRSAPTSSPTCPTSSARRSPRSAPPPRRSTSARSTIPHEAAEFVDVIDRHAKRLRQLVDDLLDLSKIEAKSFRLALGELDIAPSLEHVTRLLAEAARRRRVTLTVDAAARSARAARSTARWSRCS